MARLGYAAVERHVGMDAKPSIGVAGKHHGRPAGAGERRAVGMIAGARPWCDDGRHQAVEHLPQALREFLKLGLPEALRVSELLEIPTVVASTDLVGIFASSMGRLLERRLGLRVLAIPIQLPPLPIYMIWHKARRNDTAHRWLRELVRAKLGH